MSKLKTASLFAGIGGIDLGFSEAGFQPIWANEIDKYCATTFTANHKDIKLVVDDVTNIKGQDIPKVDILTAGFPCQPFSVAGYRKGFEDDRGNMFFQIIRLVKEMSLSGNKPRVLFLENVKNLKTHDNGNTYNVIKKTLEKNGYYVKEKVLNTCEYGNLPQNRERIFIIGFLNKKDYDNFKWPNKIPLKNKLTDIVDWNKVVPEKYLYKEDKKCYKLLKENITEHNTIYQYRRVYVRKNKNDLCPTLTANMGMGGHNVPLIYTNYGEIRKLLPIECLELQGFPSNFIIPKSLADSRVYKQAGNSVSVTVIKRVAEKILESIKETDNEDNKLQ